jgi:hypothetical protein
LVKKKKLSIFANLLGKEDLKTNEKNIPTFTEKEKKQARFQR